MQVFWCVWEDAQTFKNIVAADNEGNWALHVAIIQDSVSIFCEFDALNYLLYSSLYVAQIDVLEVTHLWLYCPFSISARAIWNSIFCNWGRHEAEANNTALVHGTLWALCFGNSRSTGTVAEFELLFHEFVVILNLMGTLMNKHLMEHTECRM